MFNANSIGSLDGITMVEMNNLAVGYFPNHVSLIGIYPPPIPSPIPEQPSTKQDSETNS